MDNYRNKRAVNASLIKECLKSPFHGYMYLNQPPEPSASMSLGTLVHALVLEPKTALNNFYVIPKGAKTASHEEAAGGRQIVRAQVLEEAQAIAKAVRDCKPVVELLDRAATEIELDFDVNGTPAKARIDGYIPDGTLLELKTSNEIYTRDFVSSIIRYSYDVQCAFYAEALRRNNKPINKVIMIKVTNEAPYIVDVFELDNEFIELGNRKIDRVFHIAAKLIDGWVPTQTNEVKVLQCPDWAQEK